MEFLKKSVLRTIKENRDLVENVTEIIRNVRDNGDDAILCLLYTSFHVPLPSPETVGRKIFKPENTVSCHVHCIIHGMKQFSDIPRPGILLKLPEYGRFYLIKWESVCLLYTSRCV